MNWNIKRKSDGSWNIVSGDGKTVAFTLDANGMPSFPANAGGQQFVDVTIASADILALHATPKPLVAAPGAGFALVLDGAIVNYKHGGTAYTVGAGSDLSVKYTDASGTEVAQIETTGFLDQATDQVRYARAHAPGTGDSSVNPVANAALVLNVLSAEVTLGTGTLKLRVFYRVIPTSL